MRLRNAGQAMVQPSHFLPWTLGDPPAPLIIEPSSADIRADEDNNSNRFQDSTQIYNSDLVPSRLEDNCLSSDALCNSANLNNNEGSIERQRHCSESTSVSSRDDSLGPYEGQSSSSIDIFPQGDEYQCFSQEDATDSDFSDDGNCGTSDDLISGNPNYPSFDSATDSNGNGRDTDSVNHFDSDHHTQKDFYDKPKFESCYEIVHDLNIIGEASENSVCEVTGNSSAGHDNVFPEINFVISSANHKFEFSPKESYQDSGVCSVATTDGEFDSYETTFLVHTALFPVSGVFETAILPEDDSDVTPSPSEEKREMDCQTESSTKLAKDSENEKRAVERDEEKKRKPSSTRWHDEKNTIRKNEAVRLSPKKSDVPMFDPRRSGNARSRGSRRQDMKAPIDIGMFDVYNIETTMPNFDLDAIESHLKAAKEEEQRVAETLWKDRKNNNRSETENNTELVGVAVEVNPIANSPSSDFKWPVLTNNEMHWLSKVAHEDEREDLIERFNSISQVRPLERRRNDRDEIRRRLAMGPDNDELYCGERTERGRKPSLQSRLQSGMNLQICFMNDTGSDSESPNTDTDSVDSQPAFVENEIPAAPHNKNTLGQFRGGPRPSPAHLTLPLKKHVDLRTEADLFECQARLQSEARQALMQAKEMARMQMEVERQRMPLSPITQMVRTSLLKVGVPFPEERRRLSRQILTEMNVAQLQVIINDLHSQIEVLNENLVEYLMARDDLHMEQDSMLVDIEDLTRYIGKSEDAAKLTPI